MCQPYITVLCQDRKEFAGYSAFSYAISSDGHFKENRHYDSPISGTYPFLFRSGSALLKGEVFIFGGMQNTTKVAKISDCGFEEIGQLLNGFDVYWGSLTALPDDEKIVLCEGYSSSKCESFDGLISTQTYETRYQHKYGSMAVYENSAIIVGGQSDKVEIMEENGWREAAAFPYLVSDVSCVSVGDRIIAIGGYALDIPGNIKDVFLYRAGEWSSVGKLQSVKFLAVLLCISSNLVLSLCDCDIFRRSFYRL